MELFYVVNFDFIDMTGTNENRGGEWSSEGELKAKSQGKVKYGTMLGEEGELGDIEMG